jgi:hypothetical protein
MGNQFVLVLTQFRYRYFNLISNNTDTYRLFQCIAKYSVHFVQRCFIRRDRLLPLGSMACITEYMCSVLS